MKWVTIIAGVVGIVVIVVGVVMGWYGFPLIVEGEIADQVALIEDTDQYKRFVDLPIPLDFKVYIFNITNPVEANSGRKPVVKELGPYVYKQIRHKRNISREGNLISYYEYSNFEFDQTASGNFNQSDVITILNPALNSAIQILELTRPVGSFLLEKLSETVNFTFNTDNIYLNTTVQDFLFDGYKICQIDKIKKRIDLSDRQKVDSLIACIGLFVLPTKNIKLHVNEDNEKELIFTFLGHKNSTHNGRFTVNSGKDDIHKLGWIEKWENKTYLGYWKGGSTSKCNSVRGRDGVIFEPLQETNATISVYNTDICRSVDLQYKEDHEFRDVTASEFTLGKEMLKPINEKITDEACYCLNVTKGINQQNGCLMEGLHELFTCYNAPIILSFPHFLWADTEYKGSVRGLKPEIGKHETSALLELNTGTPLKGHKRVQFNMFVRQVPEFKFLDHYIEPRIIPILWLDEGFDINDELYSILYDSYVSKTYLITGITWGIIALGIVIVIGTIIFVVIKKRRSKQNV